MNIEIIDSNNAKVLTIVTVLKWSLEHGIDVDVVGMLEVMSDYLEYNDQLFDDSTKLLTP